MRPTNCNFLSPKLKTGEYVYPTINAYGTKIVYDQTTVTRRSKNNFGSEKRFRKALKLEKESGSFPGPGAYTAVHPYASILAFVNSSHHAVS